MYSAAEEFEPALARVGIRDYESAMGISGVPPVAVHRGRSVVRLEGGLYLKRFIERRGEARRERAAMRLLAEGAGPDPVPLAAFGDGRRGAFLVTRTPENTRPLPTALGVIEGADRRGLVRAVGERVRALHDRDLTCPDLFAHHLLVGLPDRVHLIDAGRLATRRGLRARARDLAALTLSLPYGVYRWTDVVRFLTAYLGERPRRDHPLLRAVEGAYRRLDRRRRHRTRRLVAAPAERAFLADHGIRDYESLHAYAGPGAERLRLLPDRENWRVSLGGRVFYVKRHRPVGGLRTTPAAAEWAAIGRFRRAGIRTMHPVALAEDLAEGSSIWVERVPGEPLDDLLRRGGIDYRERRELVREAAGIARRMMRRSMHHRDFYCCHLIADPAAPAGSRLSVIDLQRARQSEGLRSRWYVKDVAQLLHSAPRPPVTRTDQVRFLRAYFAVSRLGPDERRFARRVLKKAALIARRTRAPFEK